MHDPYRQHLHHDFALKYILFAIPGVHTIPVLKIQKWRRFKMCWPCFSLKTQALHFSLSVESDMTDWSIDYFICPIGRSGPCITHLHTITVQHNTTQTRHKCIDKIQTYFWKWYRHKSLLPVLHVIMRPSLIHCLYKCTSWHFSGQNRTRNQHICINEL